VLSKQHSARTYPIKGRTYAKKEKKNIVALCVFLFNRDGQS